MQLKQSAQRTAGLVWHLMVPPAVLVALGIWWLTGSEGDRWLGFGALVVAAAYSFWSVFLWLRWRRHRRAQRPAERPHKWVSLLSVIIAIVACVAVVWLIAGGGVAVIMSFFFAIVIVIALIPITPRKRQNAK
jgi:hypothetical protein